MFLKNMFYHNRYSLPHPERGTFSVTEPSVTGLFEDIVAKGSILRVKVTGRSMAPFLQGGEVVAIRKVPYSSLRRGDLIFFRNNQGFPVLHRLIRKRYLSNDITTVQTKGDALISPDEPVPYQSIVGKVWKIERVPSGNGQRSIDMESMRWRTINYLVALTASIRLHLYHTLARFKRRLFQVFQLVSRQIKVTQ